MNAILTKTTVEIDQQFKIIPFKETGVISVSGTSTEIIFCGRKRTPIFTVTGAEEFPQLFLVHVGHKTANSMDHRSISSITSLKKKLQFFPLLRLRKYKKNGNVSTGENKWNITQAKDTQL